MNVLQGCKWATRLAVNFTGTWRKCLYVHKVGSLLLLGLSLLLYKFVIHTCVPLFHKQAGRQQCSCFKCSWTLPPTSSFSFSSLLTTAGWSRLYRAGRYSAAHIAGHSDRHPPWVKSCATAQAALSQCKFFCLSSGFITQAWVPCWAMLLDFQSTPICPQWAL